MPASTPDKVIMFCTGLVVGLALGVPGGAYIAGAVEPDDVAVAAPGPGPFITEDDPRWGCATMGDFVCGPTNVQGAYPGRYEHGNLVQPWPVDAFGSDLAPGTFSWADAPVATR